MGFASSLNCMASSPVPKLLIHHTARAAFFAFPKLDPMETSVPFGTPFALLNTTVRLASLAPVDITYLEGEQL